ncbi:MAG: methyltransferase domain-containing protein [Acidobacteria bacterium]|nr:methyltransferase domain-containing protein [Acidobacteriota bacterium]
MLVRCPKCSGQDLIVFLTAAAVRTEAFRRDQFLFERGARTEPPAPIEEAMTADEPPSADIAECPRCRILVRRDSRRSNDPSAPPSAAAIYERESIYRPLLAPGAKVLEIGPRSAAFLEAAGAWEWDAVGVEIRGASTAFFRAAASELQEIPLDQAAFKPRAFDGVFMWSGFEQIADPNSLLAVCERVLRPGGALVLHTPNALFYRVCQRRLREAADDEVGSWITRALAYEGLLTHPFQYGYGSHALADLAAQHGFTQAAARNVSSMAKPLAAMAHWMEDERRSALSTVLSWSEVIRFQADGILTGPWMELVYRSRP